jgi:nicotinate-nucleotide adenylyltransferase
VVELARIAVGARTGADVAEASAAIERLGGERVEVVRMPALEISSTSIRRRVAKGRPVRYLVPDGVLELIEAAGLYSG